MRKFLSFDIGGTLIKYGVIKETGEFIEKHQTSTEAHLGGPSIIEKVKKIGMRLINQYDISGICISTAGQVNSQEGRILYAIPSIIPDYTGMPIKDELENFFNLPVEVENDVNCVGLAESWVGTGKDVNSLFCLTVGTGIGGSYILDNKLHTGHSFSGGEIGYIPIEGKQFQELASTRTLVNNVAKLKGIPESELNGELIFELARNGDKECIQEIDRLTYYLSKGIATIAYMMNPEMIIIGGGISAQKDYLYPSVMKYLEIDLIPSILKNTKIEIALHLNNAGMIGALRHFLLKESVQPLNRIITMIESNSHKLTKREKLIAEFILQNMEKVPNLTISQMSKETKVSEATITRFCQKLDIGSYNKLRLMTKEGIVSKRQIDSIAITELKQIKSHYINMLNKFDTLYQSYNFYQLREHIKSSKKIFIYGSEDIESTLFQIKFKMMNHSISVDVFSNRFQMEKSLNLLTQDTVVLGISLSDSSSAIMHFLQIAKDKGSKIFGITNQKESPLEYVAENILLLPYVNDSDQKNNFIYETSILYLIDITLNELTDKKEEILNHPLSIS